MSASALAGHPPGFVTDATRTEDLTESLTDSLTQDVVDDRVDRAGIILSCVNSILTLYFNDYNLICTFAQCCGFYLSIFCIIFFCRYGMLIVVKKSIDT